MSRKPDLPIYMQYRSSMDDHIKKLLSDIETVDGQDVTITCAYGKDKGDLKVHSFILRARSPVFKTMLDGECAERKEIILDCERSIAKLFIKYLYTGELELRKKANDTLCIYELAHKYKIGELEKLTKKMVIKDLDSYKYAVRVIEEIAGADYCEIEEKALKTISDRFSSNSSDAFADINADSLSEDNKINLLNYMLRARGAKDE